MTREIEVRVLGRRFSFNVPENLEPHDFQEIIRFVEKKMIRVRNEMEDIDSFRLGLLASINIAEEYFSLKKENENLRVILSRIDRMLSPLEEENQVSISFSS
jgi:cell division protein ZapA (FtsZ GTPase activity inhibitor)